jgi:hypothetical protein
MKKTKKRRCNERQRERARQRETLWPPLLFFFARVRKKNNEESKHCLFKEEKLGFVLGGFYLGQLKYWAF